MGKNNPVRPKYVLIIQKINKTGGEEQQQEQQQQKLKNKTEISRKK